MAMVNERKEFITKCVGALRQLDSQIRSDKIEGEIDANLERARQNIEENGRKLKDEAKRIINNNKDFIISKIQYYRRQLEPLDELKNTCSEVLGFSDARILTCMPTFIDDGTCYDSRRNGN